jgi:hypothetical protein
MNMHTETEASESTCDIFNVQFRLHKKEKTKIHELSKKKTITLANWFPKTLKDKKNYKNLFFLFSSLSLSVE